VPTATRSSLLSHLAAAVSLVLGGCVTEGGPRPAGRPPSGIKPESMVVLAPNLVDTNENSYRDTTPVVVYVFGDRPGYAAPIEIAGSFEFKLMDRSGGLVGAWAYTPEQTAQALRRLSPGPGYVFTLNLLDHGTDVTEVREADLVCTFTPRGADPIKARSSAPLLVGRIINDPASGRR
jgi:hypothetical protein